MRFLSVLFFALVSLAELSAASATPSTRRGALHRVRLTGILPRRRFRWADGRRSPYLKRAGCRRRRARFYRGPAWVPQTALPLRRRPCRRALPLFRGVTSRLRLCSTAISPAGMRAVIRGSPSTYSVRLLGENPRRRRGRQPPRPRHAPLWPTHTFFGGIYACQSVADRIRSTSRLPTWVLRASASPRPRLGRSRPKSTSGRGCQTAPTARPVFARRTPYLRSRRFRSRRAGCPLVVEPGQVAEPCAAASHRRPQLWDLDLPTSTRSHAHRREDGSDSTAFPFLGLRWFFR